MQAVLKLNFGQISLEISGDVTFVQDVYAPFREHITHLLSSAPQSDGGSEAKENDAHGEDSIKSRRSSNRRSKKKAVVSGDVKQEAYKPSLVKDLKTDGLAEFFGSYVPKSHLEKILIFAEFLRSKGHDPCTADQINTCYRMAGIERPKAFRQAIVDASGKQGFIEYNSVNDIRVTQIGEDHLQFKMPKASK